MGKGRVLIVDDHELDRRLSSLDLEEAGYTVSEANDVEDALQKLEKMKFDAIVLDIRMPGPDGLTFLRSIKMIPSLENLPVVMVTASDDIDDELQAMSGGAVSYITKPAHRELLVETVQKALTNSHPSS